MPKVNKMGFLRNSIQKVMDGKGGYEILNVMYLSAEAEDYRK
jgi:hypothetical protein